ncbi:NAD(P)/FAD-dependent oxidoreductase [Herminiimonas fonticola]|uniref:Rubredoxin-NAD+ reductase n=1 Tax=Herminiimonas fonticola TaxID=303380 RepID=A0A4R6G4V5_9BURK|nr:FAD-dependent oxidoreductase [Herminiimonas fonticola]RBA23049.1 Pyridine nucleotide-disulfide oxidoreductase [Herminiimonas fonticola]TDN89509.1 rubredoxin-NAD+ reductase [Herminiimonas fonticola]
MKPIIIIGAGLAGYTVAREFRKLDKTSPLIMITEDSGGYYSKPMLSNAFAHGKQAEQLITHSATQMAEQLAITLMPHTRVNGIDTAAKTVDTSSGKYEFEKLVLAVGAQAIHLGLKGDAANQVLSVNHIADYAVFRARINSPKNATPVRVAILGAGLIGCEFADDLTGAGHAVTLIDPSNRPLAALTAPALSAGLQAALLARGVRFHFGTVAETVTHAATDLCVTLADGTTVEADVVLSAVGLRPDLRLAHAAQLKTGRGIVIDTSGQTSAADIYALGDCAEYTSLADGSTRTLPYIMPIMTAGRAIARTLSGERTEIDLKPSPVLIKTPSFPLALIPPAPHIVATGRWLDETTETGRSISRFYDANDVLEGFGVSPHDNAIRQELLAGLGQKASQ